MWFHASPCLQFDLWMFAVRYSYAVRIKNHKTFSKTGKARYYPLPNILTRDLDVWLEQIRPSALKATQTLENWLKFWGHSPKELERLEQKLLNLQLSGILPQQCSSPQRYKQNLERKYEGLKSRIAAWEVAKANAEVCHNVFFSLGGSHPGSFGKAYDESRTSCISSMVSRAVGRATKALYGQAYYLNPHGFRHIGSKQVRMAGKDKAAFSALVGHTLRVDEQYAAQVTQDYELIVDFVDDWWDKSSM
ncbi:hypothetical protein [Leptolyngbya sp. ST-U4]|uniref:hypothetical protein n=1 Tax=Leptolyngbya sp. ST-U4 TaxID=2933912 RepID=UPI00329950AC